MVQQNHLKVEVVVEVVVQRVQATQEVLVSDQNSLNSHNSLRILNTLLVMQKHRGGCLCII